MNKTEIFTLGVYGLTSDEFFGKIVSNRIDTFIDIRRRRAVRGSEYSFVNSNRLQVKLAELGINYIHVIDLSPTTEIIAIQKEYDKSTHTATRKRNHLDNKFIAVYKKNILDRYDFNDLLKMLSGLHSERVLFFCVEAEASACHRSIITEKLHKEYSFNITHL